MGNSASVGASVSVGDGGRVRVALNKRSKEEEARAAPFPCFYPMRVVRWTAFEALGRLVRSDEAHRRGLLCDVSQAEDESVVLVSHAWWHRPPPPAKAEPDYPDGAHLKYQVGERQCASRTPPLSPLSSLLSGLLEPL